MTHSPDFFQPKDKARRDIFAIFALEFAIYIIRRYMKFSELDLNDQVLDALDAMRFEECTPIQEKSIPIILEGRDLIAVAQTGTGKTAAYMLPILNKLSEGGYPEDAINCIIMAPTRELAQQIDQQMQGFSYFLPVSGVAVYGGNDGVLFEQQKKGLTLGHDCAMLTSQC